MSGRYPSGRTPAGRSFGAAILVTVIFYSKVIAHKLSWTFIPTVELFTQPFKILLSAALRWVTTARFYTSKVVVKYSRFISLTRYTVVHTDKIKVVFRILYKRMVEFFSNNILSEFFVTGIRTALFKTSKMFLSLQLSLWGFDQRLNNGIINKYCNIKGSVAKVFGLEGSTSKSSNLKGGVRK